ncbi:MAG: hypothetical protein PHD66_01550 [Eubacteriales bacterium]|nr:hypothetical protein [Eubacteriales bacterium]
MRKVFIVLLAGILVLSFTSCNGDETNESMFSGSTEKSVLSDDKSDSYDKDKNESEKDISSETSEQERLPDYIPNFVSFAPLAVSLRATDSTSIRLTKINETASYGDVVLFTSDFGSRISAENDDFSEFAVMVCEYDHNYFGYVKKSIYKVGETDVDKTTIEIPPEGFVIVAHSAQTRMIGKFDDFDSETPLFVSGIQLADVGFSIDKTNTPITIDGVVDRQWENFKIDTIDENNQLWQYSSFDKGDYYATAEYFASYDDDYIYLAVIVNSPYHYCPISPGTAGDMWKYECIQVKVVDQSPLSDFMLEHYDHIIDNTAVKEGHVRSYGFAVSDAGETCFYESGINTVFGGKAKVVRDDNAQTTTYEVAITWEEFGIDSSSIKEFGLTFSINSTNEEDFENSVWKNLILRDGGGVIGRNDWSKIPVVTLNE